MLNQFDSVKQEGNDHVLVVAALIFTIKLWTMEVPWSSVFNMTVMFVETSM